MACSERVILSPCIRKNKRMGTTKNLENHCNFKNRSTKNLENHFNFDKHACTVLVFSCKNKKVVLVFACINKKVVAS
jgi:hypothetical protein